MKALVSIQTEKTLYHNLLMASFWQPLTGDKYEEFNRIQSKTSNIHERKTRLDRKLVKSAYSRMQHFAVF